MSDKPIAVAGPFTGVRYVDDAPYEDAQKFLYYAENGYFRQADGVVSWLARPGFTCTNPAAQMGTGQRSQGAVAFTSAGTIYRFLVVNGVLYRSNAAMSTFTDVSPVGIAIDTAATSRVSFVVVGASVVVSDGVNRPWVMTAFAATPVTGTYIQINAAGDAWSAYGKPTIYQDSVMFIAQTVPGGSSVQSRVGVVWSEPNQPSVGYTQTGYSDFWNIIENNTEPLTAILGTNSGFFYWRANSIGVATGTPSINFSTTATRDYRGDPVGTVSPWAVVLFQDNIFFLDAKARPWMMPLLGDPQPIWLQLAHIFNGSFLTAASLDPSFLSYIAIGSVVPELNQVALAFAGSPTLSSGRQSPQTASVFDGATGAYAGEWRPAHGFTGFDTLGTLLDANGLRVLYLGGGISTTATSGGYVWILNALSAGVWADIASGFPAITSAAAVETHALGYSASRLLCPDYATFIVKSSATMSSVLIWTSSDETTVLNVAPVASTEATNVGPNAFRAVLGLGGTATRYLKLVPSGPNAATEQWGITRIEVFGSTSNAGPDDR